MSGRPREFEGEDVIEAAMDVFWSHGYEGSSTQALCERTGLGRGSLYNAFGNKQALYLQALRFYHERGIQIQSGILNGPGTPRERLRALLEWGIGEDLAGPHPRSCMALFAAMERGRKDPAVREITHEYGARFEGMLCHVFALGQRSGDFSAGRPALEQARAFMSSYYGLRVLGQSMADGELLHDVLEGTLARL